MDKLNNLSPHQNTSDSRNTDTNYKKLNSCKFWCGEIFKSELGIFLYKILNDIFVLLLVSEAMLLVAEGIMPGLIGAYLSFTKLTLIVFAVLGAIIYLGKLNDISFEFSAKKTVLFYGLIIFAVILIINSLLKFVWWENAVITIASVLLIFYFYKNFKE